MMGTIRLFNKQTCNGCVSSDDGGDAMFFHRECVSPDYQPKVGDRVTFTTRASPRTGSLEAYRIAPLVKSAA